jgi:hypothetical protein
MITAATTTITPTRSCALAQPPRIPVTGSCKFQWREVGTLSLLRTSKFLSLLIPDKHSTRKLLELENIKREIQR